MKIAAISKSYGTAAGPFGFPMHDEIAKFAESTWKRLSSEIKERCKATIGDQTVDGYCRLEFDDSIKETDDAERSDISLITTRAKDRDREIIMPGGLDFSQYRKNPVVLLGHDYRSLPCGRCAYVTRSKETSPEKDGWIAKTIYPEPPADWKGVWVPNAVWHLTQEKVLRGKSIGFIPTEGHVPTPKEIEADPTLEKVWYIITKGLILEYSVVPVPSNPAALVQSLSKGKQKGIAFGNIFDSNSELVLCDDMSESDPSPTPKVVSFPEISLNTAKEAARKRLSGFLTKELIESSLDTAMSRVTGQM